MSDETSFRSRSPLDPLTPFDKKSRGRIPHRAPPPGIFGDVDVDTRGTPNSLLPPWPGWLRRIALRSENGGTLRVFTDPSGEDMLLVTSRDEDVPQPSATSAAVHLTRREFLALGLLLDDAVASRQRPEARRKGGRPRMSRSKARQLLLRRMQQLSGTRDPLEPLTNIALAGVKPKRNKDTISDWLKRAEWDLDDLDVEWSRRRRKKPE